MHGLHAARDAREQRGNRGVRGKAALAHLVRVRVRVGVRLRVRVRVRVWVRAPSLESRYGTCSCFKAAAFTPPRLELSAMSASAWMQLASASSDCSRSR